MPSINEVLERTARARPDGIDDAVKAAWLLELDGKLRRDAAEEYALSEPLPAGPVSWPEDGAVPLLAGPPDDEVYDLYVFCRGDELNREYDHYANSAALFDAALDEWKKRFHRTHRPKSAGRYVGLL